MSMTELSESGKRQPMDSGQSIPATPHYCPHCGQAMKPVAPAPRCGADAESHGFACKSFACKACGVIYTEAATGAAEPAESSPTKS